MKDLFKSPIAISIAIVVLGLAALIAFDPLTGHRAYRVFVVAWAPALALLLPAAAGIFISARKSKNSKNSMETLLAAAVVGISVGIVAMCALFGLRYWNTQNVYAEVPVVSEEQPDFLERTPWTVADYSANSAISGINGDRQTTKFLTGSDSYATPVTARGFISPGYEAVVEQNLRLDVGSSETEQCSFDRDNGANDRVGGWLHHSLAREIAAVDRSVFFKDENAWTYCDDTPYVVVPLVQYDGNFLNRHLVPAGVAIYDGSNGEVEIQDEVSSGDLPGAVVSQWYAEKIEGAMPYRDNSSLVSVMLGQTGFTSATEDKDAGDDPNEANPGNHQLAYSDGGSAHVSSLSRVSSGTAVEFVLTTDSHEVVAGEHPDTQMRTMDPPRESNAVLAQDIQGEYSDLGWDSGLTVQEVAPGPDGTWVATIGQNTRVVYRVTMQGETPADWDLRRVGTPEDDEDTSDEDGSTVEDAGDTGDFPAVEDLSDEELRELGDMIMDELYERTYSE